MAPWIEHKKPIRSSRTNRSRKSPSPKINRGGVTPSPDGVKKNAISSSYSTNILSWLASWFVTKKIRSLSPEKADAILSTLPTELQNFNGVKPPGSDSNESSVVHELPAKAFPTSVTIPGREPLTTDVVSVNELHGLPAGTLNAQELPAIESPVYELPANESHTRGSPTNKSLAYELHVQELPTNESPAYGVPAFQYPVAQTYVKSKQFPTSAGAVYTSRGYGTPAFTIQTPPPTPPAVEQMLDDPMNFEMEDIIPLRGTDGSFRADISFDV
ncbi:hypothetical protein F4809DRAFT_644929 [Biscogniauxia mediterranea]|nr:hypothetical protein F4809DRAFT_644929 [Biscogniauxia mediterranea]